MSSNITPLRKDLRAHVKLPQVGHIPKSYALMVRDGIADRLKKMSWFKDFNFTSDRSLQIQSENLPFCGVYMMEQIETPDGDANAAEPRFRVTVRIGFSVIVQNNDPVIAEQRLDTAYQAIVRGLLMDSTLYNNHEFQIQAFTRGHRMHQFGAIGQNNEWPVAELRYELTCDLGTIAYEPLVPDILETVHIEMENLQDAGDPSVQKTIAEWTIETD